MTPEETGKQYDKIAQWWSEQHVHSNYGVVQLERAAQFAKQGGKALDVGCGAGGRMVSVLEEKAYAVTGVDVSAEMVRIARSQHPQHNFYCQDIAVWESDETFDLILAWDSLFHLPFHQQRPVLLKLCQLLCPGGVLVYSFGDDTGEHTDRWRDETFYYSSIGVRDNLQTLISQGLIPVHLELDQFPEKHAYIIAVAR